jgi:hypothetical protein
MPADLAAALKAAAAVPVDIDPQIPFPEGIVESPESRARITSPGA